VKIRILLISLLVGAAPVAAQRPAADVPPLRSGTPVRVFLEPGSGDGAEGVALRGTRDTLVLVSPALGLVRLPAAAIQRLETTGGRGPAWRYPAYVLLLSAGVGLMSPPEDFFPMFMNGLIIFGVGGGVAYMLQPPRRALSIDPSRGLPEIHQDPARPGVPVRISTTTRWLTPDLLHDFSADSVYLFSSGVSTPVARVEILRLQVSVRRDRGRGARIGGRVGALAGALVGTGWVVLGSDSEWRFAVAPAATLVGAGFGWAVGTPAGWALAPRRWQGVPLHAPER
jgi:hypothetical protein